MVCLLVFGSTAITPASPLMPTLPTVTRRSPGLMRSAVAVVPRRKTRLRARRQSRDDRDPAAALTMRIVLIGGSFPSLTRASAGAQKHYSLTVPSSSARLDWHRRRVAGALRG